MIESELVKLALAKFKSLGFDKNDFPTNYRISDGFKATLISSAIDKEVRVINSSRLEITLPKSEYLTSILTDFHFGKTRIEKQIEHLDSQINEELQAAWTIVTTYYACYFMCNEISRISGKFITNLTENEQHLLLSHKLQDEPSRFNIDGSSSFAVVVTPGINVNEVKLDLIKTGSRPHQVAWTNISSLINNFNVKDKREVGYGLLKKIISASNKKWSLPSEIRNEWNYSATHFYGESGTEISKEFLSLMKQKSSYKWASKINRKPHQHSKVAALAYVYTCLSLTYNLIKKDLNNKSP
jgi:hypothetical protein